MRILHWCLRSGRALAGLVLLATLFAGELADTRHHLSEHGCTTDAHSSGREDHCTCAGLHAAPLAGHAPVALAAVEIERATGTPFATLHASRHGVSDAAPRAPPRS